MNQSMLISALIASLSLVACDKPPTVVNVPSAVPGPAGPQGATGVQGNRGATGNTGNQGNKGDAGKPGENAPAPVPEK